MINVKYYKIHNSSKYKFIIISFYFKDNGSMYGQKSEKNRYSSRI